MLIIDGDLYVYRAGFAMRGKEIGFKLVNRDDPRTEIDLGNISLSKAKEECRGKYTREHWKLVHYNNPFPLHFILANLDNVIEDLLKRYDNSKYQMFITASDYSNYRFSIATIQPYKGGRKKCVKCLDRCSESFGRKKETLYHCKNCGDVDSDTVVSDKPHYYREIRDHLVSRWNAEVITKQEADDAVSILAMELKSQGIDSVMVHIDKDIDNTPGVHYNPDSHKEYIITEEESLNHFYTQFILGDKVDNIPGVFGAGKVAAFELLKDCKTREDYENVILDVYQGEEFPIKRFKNKMNLTPDEAYARLTEVGQLLHIRQEENELWKPQITV